MKKHRKRITISIVIILALILVRHIWISNRVLGTYRYNQAFFCDGRVYSETDDYHMFKYRGRIIGKLTTGSADLYVFAVKGEPTTKYIYIGAMGRGEFYKIKESVSGS